MRVEKQMIDTTPLVRMNSRIRKDQKKYIQVLAKARSTKAKKVGDGEIHREIIDYYIKTFKK
jgi:hypothetical protein